MKLRGTFFILLTINVCIIEIFVVSLYYQIKTIVMKTRKFCPHCGRPVVKSQIKGYVFQCFACDEDFYRFEVYGKKDLPQVKKIRSSQMLRDRLHGHSIISFKKPYPRSKV